jgi:hypothetical protein
MTISHLCSKVGLFKAHTLFQPLSPLICHSYSSTMQDCANKND